MAWGTPTSIGSGGATLLATVPAGALVVIAVCEESVSGNGAVTDSAGNTYTLAQSTNNLSGSQLQVYYSVLTSALSVGTISYTRFGGATNVEMVGLYVTGAKAGPLDTNAAPAFVPAPSQPSNTSAAPIAAGELFVGVVFLPVATGATLIQASGWNSPPVFYAGTTVAVAGGYLINVGSGAVTYAPTLSASANSVTFLLSFVAAPPPAASFGIVIG
jgi:hypothetical protein